MITDLKKTLIIAEACDNHFGKLDNAKQMVISAKISGADVVKFQHHLPDEEMLPDVYKSKNFKISLYDFLKKYSLKLKDHYELKKFCKQQDIKYLCTPFSAKAAIELNELGVSAFKIGSGEFGDIPFIESVCKFKKPVIFSTGMSTIGEIHNMYLFLRKFKNKFAFMNCTSEYPPVYKDINLGFIKKLIKKYPNYVIGHSDHTNTIYTSIAAVAMGAKIIEKHVYLKGKNFGPDRDVSISFDQLKEMVTAIRIIEQSFGEKKIIHHKEKEIVKWAKRSLVSLKDLEKGKVIQLGDIWSKRPFTGIPSKYYYKILGKKLKKNIPKNTILKYSDINQ
jgi:N-acetylneuraminate synthase